MTRPTDAGQKEHEQRRVMKARIHIAKQIEEQFPAKQPPDDYQFEFSFGVKLDIQEWRAVLVALRAFAAPESVAKCPSCLCEGGAHVYHCPLGANTPAPKEKHSEVPTPRTDHILSFMVKEANNWSLTDLARQLERELADERRLTAALRDAITRRGKSVLSASQQSDTAKLYHDLLLSVGNRYPGETRHETAKRYILEAERGGLHAGQAYADSAALSSTASKEGEDG